MINLIMLATLAAEPVEIKVTCTGYGIATIIRREPENDRCVISQWLLDTVTGGLTITVETVPCGICTEVNNE